MLHMSEPLPGATPEPRTPRRRRRQTADDVRSGRRSLAMWGLSILFGALAVSSVIGENGYLATLRAEKEQRQLEVSLAGLREENRRLQTEAARLREEPAALEEAARRDLGFVKPGETLVILRDTRPAPPPAR